MAFCIWTFFLLTSVVAFTDVYGFVFPPPQNLPSPQHAPPLLPTRLRRVAQETRSTLRIPLFHHDLKHPYVVIQPVNRRQGRRLVLTLPKDNIQILSAEAGGTLPLTLSLRDPESERGRYSSTRNYASQMQSPPRQASKFHYGFLPMPDSEEQERRPWNKGEVVYDMEDLIGSSGGHVTVIKAHSGGMPKIVKARKVMSSGKSMKPMKAIFIEPKDIEAKRVHLVDADVEKVTATKARLLGEPMVVHGAKAKGVPVSYKKGVVSKSKGEDWAASNLHFVKAEPPQEAAGHRGEDEPPMELQCGGNNDLGWCDLGTSYPSTEVSQIMEVCEELVGRMFVEVPEDPGDMEDIASYSLSRNISSGHQGAKPFWPWKSHVTDMKRSLCDVNIDVIRPSFAQDVKGKWHVIIQTDAFPQRIALEVCKKPGGSCSSSDLCSSSQSQCVQKYSHHQLISFDPESAETCPYIRLYKFPTSCVCRLT